MRTRSFAIFQTNSLTTNLPTASQREGFGGLWAAKYNDPTFLVLALGRSQREQRRQ